MASIMGGNYPGGGITLGPAMTFGYIAGRHLAGVAGDKPAAQEMGVVPSPADDQDHHIALPAEDQFTRVAEPLTIRR
jgi:hypothetical protein